MNNNYSVLSIFRVLIILSICLMLFIFQSISFRLIPPVLLWCWYRTKFSASRLEPSVQVCSVHVTRHQASYRTTKSVCISRRSASFLFFNTHLAEWERQIFPSCPSPGFENLCQQSSFVFVWLGILILSLELKGYFPFEPLRSGVTCTLAASEDGSNHN